MKPSVTAVVCTRNRSSQVVMTIQSLLANSFPGLVVILIDQSTNFETEIAIGCFQEDPRFLYIRSNQVGVSRARNLGLAVAESELVLFTDDDCQVPDTWVSEMMNVFQRFPKAAIVFCSVNTPDYDESIGYIPNYICKREAIFTSRRGTGWPRGISAGMGVKRKVILTAGGFDNQLGPGSKFWSSEDKDLAIRVLIKGSYVVETDRVAVTHYGFRKGEEVRKLFQRDWMGIGAMHSKLLRSGYLEFLFSILYETLYVNFIKPLTRLLLIKKPKGLRNFLYFWMGFFQSLYTPVDSERILFKSNPDKMK